MSPKIKPWLFLAMIFVAGIMTRAALTIGLGSHFRSDQGAQPWKSHWMAHLVERLNLTADQQAKIQPIVDDSENQIQAVFADGGNRVEQIIKKTNTQIAALLTPDQQATLEKMSKDMESRHDRMFPGHHPWGGPGGMGQHGGPGGQPPPPPPPGH